MLIAMKPGRLLFCTLYKYKSFVKIVAKLLILGLCLKEKSKNKGEKIKKYYLITFTIILLLKKTFAAFMSLQINKFVLPMNSGFSCR